MLVLNTFALGKSVPVSRGELIEIGGSFRLPDLMTRSGCELTEVGTTNRTHPADFARVAPSAAMLLKVHPSNYHIDGVAKEVTAREHAALAKEHGIPSCVDLGSGTLVDLTKWGLPKEPTPQSVLADGIDLITFSGDKLLGGLQDGLGDGMALPILRGCGVHEQSLFIVGRQRVDPAQPGLLDGQGAGLVEHHRIQLLQRFQ